MFNRRLVVLAVGSLLALCAAASIAGAQALYSVNITTSGLNGVDGGLAFDLISGDNTTPNNTVTMTDFTTDGTLAAGGNTNQGDATGDLPGSLLLHDSAFSESFRSLTFGNSLSFSLASTDNFAAPGAPDEFSFFLTDPTNTGALVTTTDPTGANALFVLDLNGTGTGSLTVFSSLTNGVSFTVTPAQQSVPEPSSLALAMGVFCAGGILIRSRLRRR